MVQRRHRSRISTAFFNMSYGTNNTNIFKQTAKKIVFEVRSDYPWAEGGRFNTIHIDDIDYWVEVDCEKYKWPQINEKAIKSKPEEQAIAQHVMSIMRDRDIVQLGIGALPSACVTAMADAGFKDLGIHTEMLNYGLITLIESGQVTNAYKTIDRGKSVWTFAFPVDVQWYYDTVHRNQQLAVYDIGYTNNFQILSRIDNMIAIDNCVAVDLLGQQCAGFYEKRPISSTGGYFQFVSFCAMSKRRQGGGIHDLQEQTRDVEDRSFPPRRIHRGCSRPVGQLCLHRIRHCQPERTERLRKGERLDFHCPSRRPRMARKRSPQTRTAGAEIPGQHASRQRAETEDIPPTRREEITNCRSTASSGDAIGILISQESRLS